MFGQTGAHLWNKFTLNANRSVTLFVRMLDSENETKFYQYLEKTTPNGKINQVHRQSHAHRNTGRYRISDNIPGSPAGKVAIMG